MQLIARRFIGYINDMPDLVAGKYLEQEPRVCTLSLYFYAILNSTEPTWRKDFGYPCDPKGTDNVRDQRIKRKI